MKTLNVLMTSEFLSLSLSLSCVESNSSGVRDVYPLKNKIRI